MNMKLSEYGRLTKKKCVPCKGNIPPLDIKEIHKYLKKINGWEVKNKNNSYFLEKNYKFKTMPIIFYDIKKDFNYKPL